MAKKSFHKLQALTLIVAVVLLWFNFGLGSTIAKIIISAIILLNAIPEALS